MTRPDGANDRGSLRGLSPRTSGSLATTVLFRILNENIHHPGHWYRALGCERGARISLVSFHAPVTGRPAVSRGQGAVRRATRVARAGPGLARAPWARRSRSRCRGADVSTGDRRCATTDRGAGLWTVAQRSIRAGSVCDRQLHDRTASCGRRRSRLRRGMYGAAQVTAQRARAVVAAQRTSA